MMDKNVLKGLLAVSAVAAMFSAFGVQAQTAGSTAQPSQSDTMGKDKSMGSSSGTSGMSGSTGTGGASMQGASGAAGATAAAGSMSKADQKILVSIAQGNMAEIEVGKLAQGKSDNAEVKAFAQQMIDDHTKAQGEIQALAQQKGVTLPTELNAKNKAMATKLDKMSGDAFNKTYMTQAGVAAHRTMYNMLVKDEASAKDPDLKALISKMTPVVEQHLRSAQQMPAPKTGAMAGK
jgi:predicted outer membrane protein